MGEGLFQKVQDCYAFLGNVYDPGDKILLFGFSRGAFTARSIGGLFENVCDEGSLSASEVKFRCGP